MRMLKHHPSGRIYVYHEALSRAEGMEEYEDPDFGVAPVVQEEKAENVQEEKAENVQEERTENVQENCTESVKSLDEMSREEMIAVAIKEAEARGDSRGARVFARMKKADLIEYITGEGA